MTATEQESEPNQLFATAACLMDGDTGRVLFGKRETDPMAMASTTKIMTCILALENGQEQTVATASAKAAAAPKVHLGVREGEQFLLGDLLYSLMLESHNDAAVMIAETIGGSVEEFASLMNEKAAAIGCTDTHFVTPNGLDASDAGGDHHTTAADLARIMRYCVWISPKAAQFLAVTQTRSYTFWDLEKKNMYSPLFSCAYQIFNEAGNKSAIRDMIIQACQYDKRTKEYIDVLSRMMYRIIPNYWYRRNKSLLD